MSTTEIPDASLFDSQKQLAFTRIGLQLRDAMRIHQQEGMLAKNEAGQREWGNVAEHCLVEAPRIRVPARILGLSDDIINDAMIAAGLHDAYKKSERAIVEAGGITWESFEVSNVRFSELLREANFSERVIRLTQAVGHGSLAETERLLDTDNLNPEDIAYLIIHYVDDYTRGSDWAEQAAEGKGELIRRFEKNEANPRYRVLDTDGREHFGGRTTFEAQREIGMRTEQLLADLLSQAGFPVPNAQDLPVQIDNEIRNEILNS